MYIYSSCSNSVTFYFYCKTEQWRWPFVFSIAVQLKLQNVQFNVSIYTEPDIKYKDKFQCQNTRYSTMLLCACWFHTQKRFQRWIFITFSICFVITVSNTKPFASPTRKAQQQSGRYLAKYVLLVSMKLDTRLKIWKSSESRIRMSHLKVRSLWLSQHFFFSFCSSLILLKGTKWHLRWDPSSLLLQCTTFYIFFEWASEIVR